MLDIVLRSVNKMGWVLTLGQGAEKINTIWNNTGGCPPSLSPHLGNNIMVTPCHQVSWWDTQHLCHLAWRLDNEEHMDACYRVPNVSQNEQ